MGAVLSMFSRVGSETFYASYERNFERLKADTAQLKARPFLVGSASELCMASNGWLNAVTCVVECGCRRSLECTFGTRPGKAGERRLSAHSGPIANSQCCCLASPSKTYTAAENRSRDACRRNSRSGSGVGPG